MSLVRKTRSAQTGGFTLIEMLVTMILLCLVFVLLLAAIQFGTKLWSNSENEVDDTSQVLTVQNLLRRVLSQARPIMLEADKSERRRVYFEGTNNSIRLVAPITRQFAMGGFFEIAVYLSASEPSPGRLEISLRRFHTEVSSDGLGAIDLMDGVTQLDINYFGSRETGQPARWYSDWHNAQYLPELISVRVSRGGQAWPELMVATKVRSTNLIQAETNPEGEASNLP